MADKEFSQAMFDSVKVAVRKLEAYTNIPLYLSPIPEEIEVREEGSLTGHFVGFTAFSEVSAIRFNSKFGISNKKLSSIFSCDVWTREAPLNKPAYTVRLNPNSKTETSGGLRTVADLLLGKKTLLKKEEETRHLPVAIREKTQNDIEEFIDAMGIDNLKSESLTHIYDQYVTWADSDSRRVLSRPQFNRIFKDFLVTKRVVSDTISTGHVYPGASYIFHSDPEENKIFEEEIVRNQTYYKARLIEVLTSRMAHGDPEVNSLLVCGKARSLSSIKTQIKTAGAQKRTVYLKEIYGFAGFLSALWQNRVGKILIFDNADSLFSSYNSTVRGILHTLLQKDGEVSRTIRYSRPSVTPSITDRKKENIEFLLSEVKRPASKTFQPKPNTVSKNKDFDIDDILDSEDKVYNVEDEGIPEVFEFKSKIIFLTDLVSVPEDFRDSPFAIEVHYTKEQALSLVEANLEKIMTAFPELNLRRKIEILQFMRKNKTIARQFDYETFWHISEVYMSGLKGWQKWGLAQLAGRYVPM